MGTSRWVLAQFREPFHPARYHRYTITHVGGPPLLPLSNFKNTEYLAECTVMVRVWKLTHSGDMDYRVRSAGK